MTNEQENALIEWARQQPKWQQHALRLIAEFGSADAIPEDDRKQIKEILFQEAKGENPDFTPITISDIPNITASKPKTYLKSLGPVTNIDKLASDQKAFEFISPNGMTVIFGNNGSGKSGYARILKNLCRSHGKIKPLKGDATSEKEANWEVFLNYAEKANGEDERENPLKWTKAEQDKTKQGDEYTPLNRIAFFDSQIANTYVNENRRLFYAPLELRFYTELANLAGEFNKQIEQKINETKFPPLPNTTEGTNPHVVISQLREQRIGDLTEETINSICVLSDKERQDLDTLRIKQAQTPEQQKTVLNEARNILAKLQIDTQKLTSSLSSKGLSQLLAAYKKYQDAKKKAEGGVAKLAETMPISNGIGSDVWLEMFRAARKFAGEVHPEDPPPPIANGDYCVLCHQDLDEDAKKRLRDFDAFMDGALQRAANEARETYETARDKITSLPNLAPPETIRQQLQRYADLSEANKKSVETVAIDATTISNRLNEVRGIINESHFDDLQPIIDDPVPMNTAIPSLIEKITAEEQRLDDLITKDMDGLSMEERHKLSELDDKNRCASHQQNIENYFRLLKKLQLLEKYKNQLNTRQITAQSKSREATLLSAKLGDSYRKEIDNLNLAYLNIAIKTRGEKGETRVESSIEGLKQKHKKSEILSEGEQKAVALAGFLTEVNEVDTGHAIIFDDPVSSLDWDRKIQIAERLVNEAKKRQVIIFTHDFSFALQLEHCSKNQNEGNSTKFKQLWIGRQSHGNGLKFGMVGEDFMAWDTKKTKKRLAEIDATITDLENSGLRSDGSGHSEFDIRARGIATQLRQTWERAVEEVAFNNTINRLTLGVRTQNLKNVRFNSNKHYQKIHQGMSTLNFSVHDNAEFAGNAAPTLEQLKSNKTLLEEWICELRDNPTSS